MTHPNAPLHQLLTNTREQLSRAQEHAWKLNEELGDRAPELGEQLFGLIEAFETAQERLAAPRLTVAMVGTTSAGKSTLLGGILGRRLAPIDNDEMSAGVLEFQHSDDWEIQVRSGSFALPAQHDELAIYDAIHTGMREWHERRRTTNDASPTPHIAIRCPLAPLARGPQHGFTHMFGQQYGDLLGFEAIDLPGLRTTDDNKNLEVIRSRLRQAFCIVTLDYATMFDRERRDKLLDELSENIRLLGGRTSTMLFVLNRADLRNTTDRPINEQVAEAKRLVETHLSKTLERDVSVELIPFSGLLYFHSSRYQYACLEGADASQRRELLGTLLRDCGHILDDRLAGLNASAAEATAVELKLAVGEGGEEQARFALEDLLEDNKRALRRNLPLDDTKEQQLAQLLIKLSDQSTLWRVLFERLNEHARDVLISPHLYNLRSGDALFFGGLRRVIQTRSLAALEEAQQQIELLQRTSLELEEALEHHLRYINDSFREIAEILRELTLPGAVEHAETAFGLMRSTLVVAGIPKARLEADYGSLITPKKTIDNIASRSLQEALVPVLQVLEPSKDRNNAQPSNLPSTLCDRIASAARDLRSVGYDERFAAGVFWQKKLPESDRPKYQKIHEKIVSLVSWFNAAVHFIAQRELSIWLDTLKEQAQKLNDDMSAALMRDLGGAVGFHLLFDGEFNTDEMGQTAIHIDTDVWWSSLDGDLFKLDPAKLMKHLVETTLTSTTPGTTGGSAVHETNLSDLKVPGTKELVSGLRVLVTQAGTLALASLFKRVEHVFWQAGEQLRQRVKTHVTAIQRATELRANELRAEVDLPPSATSTLNESFSNPRGISTPHMSLDELLGEAAQLESLIQSLTSTTSTLSPDMT